MSLIAPSNLLALQSYSGPSQARPQASARTANDVFKPLDEAASQGNGARGDREGGGVTVNLSQDAVRHLDAAPSPFAFADELPSAGVSGSPALPQAGEQPSDDRPAPPGSRLDITI